MKKHYLAVAVLALALGMTACTPKTTETTESSTVAVDVDASADTEDAEDESSFYGFVTEIADNIITVTDNEDVEAKFDISAAELSGAEEVGVGDEVEIMFPGELSEDVMKANTIDILTSAAEEAEGNSAVETDPIISGTIEAADDTTLTLETEEGTFTFNSIIAQKVTEGGIQAGVNADVTYYGDLEDTEDNPVATKIVTEDAADTEDAEVNTLTGKAAEVSTDYLVLDTEDPDNTLFSFVGTEGMFDGVKVGDTVTVIYEGTLTDKTIAAKGLK